MNVIMRADDLGISEAVDYGIVKSIKDGMINTVGLMTNLSTSEHGANLIKDFPEICLGQHTNISLGKPVSDPKLIPSLVDKSGNFKSSSVYKNASKDFVNVEEVIIEAEAQLNRFRQLTGKYPEYFEGHAVMSRKFFEGLEIVAKKNNLLFIPLIMKELLGVKIKHGTFIKMDESNNYDVMKHIKENLNNLIEGETLHLVFHPGYIDEFIMKNSSYNLVRCRELEALCSNELKELIIEKEIKVITYKDLKNID